MEHFGQYILLDKVACGGMAELFKAKKVGIEGFERVLAIKRILPHISSDEEFIGMFIAEAKLAAHLSHKNIAQIYDFGKTGENYFIAMEYVKGKDVRTLLKRCREQNIVLPLELALFIAREVLSALGYAHKQKDGLGRDLKLIHRDVSPQNILISYEGEVKVIDFGIAKAETQSQTKIGTIKGKLAYMAPEQARGAPIDHRADIFSLGIVLYEMITGERLFKGTTEINTLERVREARVDPFSSSLAAITPSALEPIVMKALSKDVNDRYQNAADMEKALAHLLFELSSADPGVLLKKFMNDLFSGDIEAENRSLAEDVTISISYDQTADVIPSGREESSLHMQRQEKTQHHGKRFFYGFLVATVIALAVVSLFLLPDSAGNKIWTSLFSLSQLKESDKPIPLKESAPKVGEHPGSFSAGKGVQPDEQQPRENPQEMKDGQVVKKAPPEAVRGNLTINAIPWAEIYIDNKHYGTTPKTIKSLKAGSYRVRLENPHYDVWTAKILVRGLKTVNISHRFEGSGQITVNAVPWGNVYLDGVLKGQTPITIEKIPARAYEIRIGRDGYADVRKTVELKPGAREFVSVKLYKEGSNASQ